MPDKDPQEQNPQERMTKDRIIRAALDCAAEKGWAQTTLRDIAAAADIDLEDIQKQFNDKNDILAALERLIDRQVIEAAPEIADDDLPPRDRLFDIMMERFDVLNEYREGFCAILDSFKCAPGQALNGLPHLGRSMSWMLEAAKINADGIFGTFKIIGLTAVYLDTLRTWKKDNSPDMGKTMAALDKNLERAEVFATMCSERKMPDFNLKDLQKFDPRNKKT